MKKILLSTALLASAINADFNGFYVGADLGIASTQNQPKMDVNGVAISFKDKKPKETGLVADLFAGYGEVFAENYYIGLDLSFGIDKSSKFSENQANSNDKAKFEKQWVVGLNPRIGYVFNNGVSMAYVKPSVKLTNMQIKKDDSKLGKTTLLKKTYIGIAPALGYQHALTSDISGFAEVSYEINGYKTETKIINNIEVKTKNKFNSTNFKVGVVYNF